MRSGGTGVLLVSAKDQTMLFDMKGKQVSANPTPDLTAQGFPKARERLEDLRRGGGRYQKTRLSRSAVSKQSEGDCVLM